MREVVAEHWLCGTKVSAEVADDYDLLQGVALICPTCQDVWWHYPESAGSGPAPTRATADEPGLPPPTASRLQRRPDDGSPGNPVLAAGWLGPALMLVGLALVLLRLSDLGPRSEAAPPRSASATTGANGAGARGSVLVRGRRFTIRRPSGWAAYTRNGATVISPARDRPPTIAIFSQSRPDLSLDEAAGLAEQLLTAQVPGGRLTGPRALRLGGRPGQRVRIARGALVREMIVLGAGSQRYALVVGSRRGARGADQRKVAGLVRSFRPLG